MVNGDKHTSDTVIVDHNHNKTSYYSPKNIRGIICATFVVILILVGITALILWLLYRPHNPRFTVVGAAVYGLNTSSPPVITAIQLTFITRNPNNRVSIYYDHLLAFVYYQTQPITPPLILPPLHHETDSTVAVSPVWPVSPVVFNGLVTDEVGAVSLRLVLTGRLRWKAGGIKTGRKGVYVGCDVLVGLKTGVLGLVPLVGPSVCKVDI
ncbi:putative Late embryogenesis abundant protein [Helianthus annuus]|nr:putative Late embryogenesis abundant protein [Helianthus annuus]